MIETSFSQPQYASLNFKGMTWGSGNDFIKGKNFNFENNTINKDFFSKSNLKDDISKNNTEKNNIFEKIKPKEGMKEFLRKLRDADEARRAQEAADRARRFREEQDAARRAREEAQARSRQQAPSQKPTPHEVFAQHGITLSECPTQIELKKAYINLARKFHPDKHPPEDREKYTEMMKAVAEAYNELK